MYIEPSHEVGISHVQRQSMAKRARSWCICVVAYICEPMLLVFATRTTWASIRPSVRPAVQAMRLHINKTEKPGRLQAYRLFMSMG